MLKDLHFQPYGEPFTFNLPNSCLIRSEYCVFITIYSLLWTYLSCLYTHFMRVFILISILWDYIISRLIHDNYGLNLLCIHFRSKRVQRNQGKKTNESKEAKHQEGVQKLGFALMRRRLLYRTSTDPSVHWPTGCACFLILISWSMRWREEG